jgi:hypothetical protein
MLLFVLDVEMLILKLWDDHLAIIKQQNDHIANLSAKIAKHELENEKFKIARSMLYNRRHPGIKNGIGFQQESNVKLNAPKKLCNFVKGKALMVQDSEGYILYPANYHEHKIRKINARKLHNVSHHAFMYKHEASSSRHKTHVKMPKKKIPTASNEHNVSFKTFDASYVLTNKSGKIVAKHVGGNTKVLRLVFGYPRCLFLMSKDPRLFGYLRTRPKFVLQVYASGGSSWIIDSGCTNHMTREKRMFSSYEKNEDP